MKILVVYATAGAGHRKAAEALHEGLKQQGYRDVALVDVLDYTNRFYKYLYSQLYTLLVARLPLVWGFFFQLVDVSFLQPVIRVLRRFHNTLMAGSFHQYLIEENFDRIFTTHFFPGEVAASLKKTGKIRSSIICVVTDFDVHRIWLSEGIDVYTVASERTSEKMAELKVPPHKVIVSGIPISGKFCDPKDVRQLKEKLRLKDFVFTVLVATGSFGIGPIEKIIDQLQGFQLLIVCGHNRRLYDRLKRKEKNLVMVFGLVDNMDELMAVSDAMITKPGGLSISEALVSGLPLIFFNAIPGQESRNVQVLKEYGVGIDGCSLPEMKTVLEGFRNSPERYQAVKEKTRALSQPRAVENIIDLIK